REYESDPLVAAAVTDLNAFTEPLTSATGEKPTPATAFRGETRGDAIGPYLSQFLWLDIPYGIKTIEQRYIVPSRGQSFLTDYAEWLACQRGAKHRSELAFDGTQRFICSARELAEYQVHRRLRPECFGGRIETHATGRREYDLHGDILQCDAV